jgi:FtsP/CotA-like multicopper oxidase with cupredoxin domain
MVNGIPIHKAWDDPITENPALHATEIWEMYNFTADAHPIHIHEVMFQVLDRERIERGGGRPRRPPEIWETGYKDTVIAYPGEITRVKARFDLPGLYVWHCHIVEHEDNEMMRPYRVGA